MTTIVNSETPEPEKESSAQAQPTPENLVLDFSAKDPVCGMIVDPLLARGKAHYRGDNYFFCSPGCMHKFTASPATYVIDPTGAGSPSPAAKKVEKDPVCGMTVDPAHAASSIEHDRKLYHFCSRGCAEKFQRDPQKYLTRPPKAPAMTGMVQIGAAPAPARHLEKDPVCGMNVDPGEGCGDGCSWR